MAFLRGLEKAPTFLVPIINPPFADNSPHLIKAVIWGKSRPADLPLAVAMNIRYVTGQTAE
jgi:hypothetical protein